jgi:soluble lytic murein transglycosylase
MQLMPRTAKFVASRMGMRKFRHSDVTKVETNVHLGAGYLKLVLAQLGHPVLASTAYNAGPSRARRWRDVKPLEGAIYIENIPFSETRDYVRKVMANSVFYSAVLQKDLTPLKARLGTIPSRDGSERIEDDELL